jgi:hypothetical protein
VRSLRFGSVREKYKQSKEANANPLSISANPLRDDPKKTQNPPGKGRFEPNRKKKSIDRGLPEFCVSRFEEWATVAYCKSVLLQRTDQQRCDNKDRQAVANIQTMGDLSDHMDSREQSSIIASFVNLGYCRRDVDPDFFVTSNFNTFSKRNAPDRNTGNKNYARTDAAGDMTPPRGVATPSSSDGAARSSSLRRFAARAGAAKGRGRGSAGFSTFFSTITDNCGNDFVNEQRPDKCPGRGLATTVLSDSFDPMSSSGGFQHRLMVLQEHYRPLLGVGVFCFSD